MVRSEEKKNKNQLLHESLSWEKAKRCHEPTARAKGSEPLFILGIVPNNVGPPP